MNPTLLLILITAVIGLIIWADIIHQNTIWQRDWDRIDGIRKAKAAGHVTPAITCEKLRIYETYSGNSDSIERSGSELEHALLYDGEWDLIEDLCESIHLFQCGEGADQFQSRTEQKWIKSGRSMAVFEASTRQKIRLNCDSQETIDKLTDLAERNSRWFQRSVAGAKRRGERNGYPFVWEQVSRDS